jgi:hypothetical protein
MAIAPHRFHFHTSSSTDYKARRWCSTGLQAVDWSGVHQDQTPTGWLARTQMPTLHTSKRLLDDHGRVYNPSTNNRRAIELLGRQQRGLDYGRYDTAGLQWMTQVRGIRTTAKITVTLVTLLEKADDNMSFRILDLRPELKSAVYGCYIRSLERRPIIFSQPPTCETSRQLRLEFMPLFYEQTHFSLEFSANKWDPVRCHFS